MAGMTQAGAAVGTAIMPGIGTAAGTLVGGLMDSFMGGGSPAQSGPAGPSAASAAVYGSGIAADNWSVNFRGTQTNSPSAYKPFEATGPTASSASGQGTAGLSGLPSFTGGGSGFQVPSWAWIALAGLIAWRASK